MQIDKFTVKDFPTIDQIGATENVHPIRVCIVTEEIIGPVRNGGIASTYYHLSKGLAAQGHEVHVLFLKGRVVQDETPEHWVEHFADFGVTLHYLETPNNPMWGTAVTWQARFMAAYEWLRDNPPFDVVHTSEWRGGLIYALMAKRLGLAFQETLFLVKTSSPHIWNRHYQMQPIEKPDLVAAAYAEQKCVELADVVIGGSAHLITFMGEIGYRVPDENVFVQPNIVDFSKVLVTDERPPRNPGDIVKTKELIFFGRLEGRKGVELFCNALDILRERGVAPDSVTFMGKWGANLATQGGMPGKEYLEMKAEAWDFPVTYITDKNQPEALSHMCSRDMIAVMPSLIENSTMAVYETLENRIPFVATAVGGTAELIDPKDHAASLVAPRSQDLADRLGDILENGQVIAHPSFSNELNLETWYGFHAYIGQLIAEHGSAKAIGDITAKLDRHGTQVETIGFCALVRRGDDLAPLVEALRNGGPDTVMLAFTEAAIRPAVQQAITELTDAGVNAELLNCIGQASGDALNSMFEASDCDAVVVANGAGMQPRAGFFDAASTALTAQPDALFTTFFAANNNVLGMPIGGDIASQYFDGSAFGPELFAIRKDRWQALGPFEPYDVRYGLLYEYVTRNVEAGHSDMLVFPEVLLDWPEAAAESRQIRNDTTRGYLMAKPLIDSAGLPLRKLLLAAMARKDGAVKPQQLRDGGRAPNENMWLMPVDWNREVTGNSGAAKLSIGLDEKQNQLLLYAYGRGKRVLRINGTEQEIATVNTFEEENGKLVTLSIFDIPTLWQPGSAYALKWEMHEDDDNIFTRFLRISKLGEDVFALTSRSPVLSEYALHSIYSRKVKGFEIENDFKISSETKNLLASAGLKSDLRPIVPEHDEESFVDDLLAMTYQDSDAGIARAKAVATSDRLIAGMQDPQAWPNEQELHVRAGLITPSRDSWPEDTWMRGWAWDKDDTDRVLSVVLMQGNTPVFTTKADFYIEHLDRVEPGLGAHGFQVPIMSDLLNVGLEYRLVVYENGAEVQNSALVCVGSQTGEVALVQERFESAISAVAQESLSQSSEVLAAIASGRIPAGEAGKGDDIRAGLIGFANGVWAEGDWLEGWTWNRAKQDQILHIVVNCNGAPVFATRADLLVPKLGKQMPGLEQHGFKIPITPAALGVEGDIEIRVVETGNLLKGKRFKVTKSQSGSYGLVAVEGQE